MTRDEHIARAEELLAQASVPGEVTSLGSASAEQVREFEAALRECGTGPLEIHDTDPAPIDVTPILLAAQVHATLALALTPDNGPKPSKHEIQQAGGTYL